MGMVCHIGIVIQSKLLIELLQLKSFNMVQSTWSDSVDVDAGNGGSIGRVNDHHFD